MKKLLLLGTALALFSCEVAPAFATTSTVNPNVPATGSALSSATLRANFLAAYNDITNLWASLASLSASLAPSATIDTTNASNISTGTLNSSLLPTVNSNTGAFGSSNAVPVITLDGKGRVTAASTVSAVGSFNGRSGSVSPASGDYTASQVTGAAPLASPTFTGVVNIGTPAITDTGVLLQATSSTAGFNQFIIQNTSSASNASANFVVNNNLGTATTYYGEMGMNSSAFTGSGAFNMPNAVYLDSQSGDLALGTLTSNAIHFVVNNGSTDAATISSTGALTSLVSTTSPYFSATGTGANTLPVGTTGQRPTAAEGQVRDNTTIHAVEAYLNGAWQQVATLIATVSQTNWYNIAAWGDSLTAGVTDALGVPYPAALSALQHVVVYNGGVGGQTSTQIASRQAAATSMYGWFNVIWAGRNNYSAQSTVLSDIAGMVSNLTTPKRFVVLSILNGQSEQSGSGGYTTLLATNAALAAAYPSNYLDIRSLLVSQYNSGLPEDVLNHGTDTPPASLRLTTASAGTITAAMTDTVSCSISLSISTVSVGSTLLIDSEKVFVSAISGSTVSGCTRGYASTTAATHLNGASFSLTDPLHLNGSGYAYVAAQVNSWINSNDAGIGAIADNLGNAKTLLSSPPPIGLTNPAPASFATAAGFTSLTGTTSSPALRLSGAFSNNDYTDIDFVNYNVGSAPTARIAYNASSSGSCLDIITSNNYASGANVDSANICYNGLTLGNSQNLYFGGTTTSYLTKSGDGSIQSNNNIISTSANSNSIGESGFAWNAGYFGTSGVFVTSSVNAQTFKSTGTTFGFSTNACGANTAVGGAASGTFKSGTTGTCTTTLFIGSAGGLYGSRTGFSCWANDETTPADLIHMTGSTATTVTFSGTTVSGDVIDFGCMSF